jgi:hypothetical protein
MIVKWNAEGLGKYTTEWRGMKLDLCHAPSGQWGIVVVVARLGGVLVCNGLPGAVVRQRWATARQAMEATDGVMDRVVARLAVTAGVAARQRGFTGRTNFAEVARA